MSQILVVDVGTQSTRGTIINQNGDIVAKEKISYQPYNAPIEGFAEKNVLDFYEALVDVCKRLNHHQIDALTLTTQRGSYVCVDKNGSPLAPAILWMDQRKIFLEKTILDYLLNFFFKILGIKEVIDRAKSECKSTWLKKYEPEIWAKTHKFLLLSGFLNYKLTGKFIDSIGSQIGYIPFDVKLSNWAKKYDIKWKVFPIEREKLPELVNVGEKIGEISSELSKLTGLKVGLPIIANASDKGCETLGLGVLNENSAAISFGTTLTIQTTQKKYKEIYKLLPPFPAALKDYFNTEIQIFRGFWLINWFKEEFGKEEMEKASETGVPPEALLDKMLSKTPPGAMGLITQPYWSAGVKYPGSEAKGVILGFSDIHDKKYLYRSIIEGLCYATKDAVLQTEKSLKMKIDEIVVGGGGSQGDEICQITANVLGRKIIRTKVYEATSLGAAINVFLSLGIYKSPKQAIENMVKIDKIFEPDLEITKIYNNFHKDIYSKIYKSLKPFYKKIRIFTNYPRFY